MRCRRGGAPEWKPKQSCESASMSHTGNCGQNGEMYFASGILPIEGPYMSSRLLAEQTDSFMGLGERLNVAVTCHFLVKAPGSSTMMSTFIALPPFVR